LSKAAWGEGTTPLSYYGKSLKKYSPFGKEGFSIFASGFAMGTLGGGLNSVMTTLYEKANQIFDPKGYEAYKQEKTKIVEGLVDNMNAFGVEDIINSICEPDFNYQESAILELYKRDISSEEILNSLLKDSYIESQTKIDSYIITSITHNTLQSNIYIIFNDITSDM
jgi:hypothetical protein